MHAAQECSPLYLMGAFVCAGHRCEKYCSCDANCVNRWPGKLWLLFFVRACVRIHAGMFVCFASICCTLCVYSAHVCVSVFTIFYVYVCVLAYVCMYIYTHLRACVLTRVCVLACLSECVCARVCVCTRVCVHA